MRECKGHNIIRIYIKYFYFIIIPKPKNARVNIPPLNTQMHANKEKPQQDNLVVNNPNDDREEQPFNSNPMDSVKNNE